MKGKIFKIGLLLGGLALFGLFLAGCASSSGPKISIENAWGRPSPMVATAGAFYMQIKNKGGEADKLVGGSSAACGTVELHESYMTDEGAMGMRPVTGGFIEVPAGGMAELKVGGMHIMCIDKLEDFTVGATLPLTLNFEKSGDISLDVEIREP
ncbi:MAG TPA: copper-binding protein [Chloroflexi bacterium]|nr:copper-binding protein [Chloroflexota bacterium]